MKKALPWVIGSLLFVFVIVWGAAGILISTNDFEEAQPFLYAGAAVYVALMIALIARALTNRCPHCGKMRRTWGRFCPYCGNELK